MASPNDFFVANPTNASVTSGGITCAAGKVVQVTDATAADIVGAIQAGCVLASADKSTTVDATVQLVEKGSRLLNALVRAVVSANDDIYALGGQTVTKGQQGV